MPITYALIILFLNWLTLILSFFLGWPPTIQIILSFDFKAYLVASKEVAFESFIKVTLSCLRKISCLWERPLKVLSDLIKLFLFMLKYFAIKYANLRLSLFASNLR